MLAPTSLAGRRLVVVMPVVHERAEGLQAFQTMGQMLLFGIRQEHIEFRDNLAHSLCRDMRILRICHAARRSAPPAQTFASLLWRAAITAERMVGLLYFLFPCEASHP